MRVPPPVDRLGRRQLHTLTMAHYILAIPGLSHRTRRVPARAVVQEDEDGAMVECPCGHKPVVPEMQAEPGNVQSGMLRCGGDCGRWYYYDGVRVYALYEGDPPPLKVYTQTPAAS